MRFVRFGLLVCLLLFDISVQGRQSQTSTTPQLGTQDPQAVNVLNLALSAAGGVTALNAITDYTATGTVTSSQGQSTQDNVTISGRGPSELRTDLSQALGTTSFVIDVGSVTTKAPSGLLNTRTMQPPMMAGNWAMPYREMAMVLSNPQFSVTSVGLIQVGSQSLLDVRAQFLTLVQQVANNNETYRTVDFLIDSTSLQLCMVQDTLPGHASPRTIAYSNFTMVSGVLVPFQIAETVGGQQIWTVQLNQITFNVGLQDSTFQLIPTAVQ